MKSNAILAVTACLCLGACQSIIPAPEIPASDPGRLVAADKPTKIDFYYSVDAQCASRGVPEAFIVDDGKNGSFAALVGKDSPNFSPESPFYKCNGAPVPGVFILYTPNPSYLGPDEGTIAVRFPGTEPSDPMTKFHYKVQVANAPKAQESAAPEQLVTN